MNGISVPAQFKNELKRSHMKREYAEACIRDYVKVRANIPLTYDMFKEVLGGRQPGPTITRLLKDRRLTRRSVRNGKFGTTYVYEWHDLPTAVPNYKIKSEHGEVVTVRAEYATALQLKRLDEWFMDFCNDNTVIEGANEFRKFIHEKAGENAK